VRRVICPARLRCAYICEIVVRLCCIGSRRSCGDEREPMPLRALIIFPLETQTGPKIFNGCWRSVEYFLPGLERSLQAIEVLGFELRLREVVPRGGIVGSNVDNAPAQFDDRGLIIRVLSCFQLSPQLLKLRCFRG